MKKNLLLLLFLTGITKVHAQIVFCPPGAEWHCHFGVSMNTVENETVKYLRDTVIDSEVVKLLYSTHLYYNCNPAPYFYTFIKQKGDTVFFRNFATQDTWQILYNFAAQPGQGWQTTYRKLVNTTFITTTNTYVVSSVSTVTINNIPLKRLQMASGFITERLGWNNFLFMLQNSGCDGDTFAWNVCYQDNTFGLEQFTSYACDSEGIVGLEEQSLAGEKIKLFPNPARDFIHIEGNSSGKTKLSIIDSYGREIKDTELNGQNKIDLTSLGKGIYFITLSENNAPFYKTKIIKE